MCFEKCNVLKIKKVSEHIKFFKMPTLHGGKNMLSKDTLQQHNRISTGYLHRIIS
jgi:hypothetical protein